MRARPAQPNNPAAVVASASRLRYKSQSARPVFAYRPGTLREHYSRSHPHRPWLHSVVGAQQKGRANTLRSARLAGCRCCHRGCGRMVVRRGCGPQDFRRWMPGRRRSMGSLRGLKIQAARSPGHLADILICRRVTSQGGFVAVMRSAQSGRNLGHESRCGPWGRRPGGGAARRW